MNLFRQSTSAAQSGACRRPNCSVAMVALKMSLQMSCFLLHSLGQIDALWMGKTGNAVSGKRYSWVRASKGFCGNGSTSFLPPKLVCTFRCALVHSYIEKNKIVDGYNSVKHSGLWEPWGFSLIAHTRFRYLDVSAFRFLNVLERVTFDNDFYMLILWR